MGDITQWAAFDRRGRFVQWIGTRSTRAEVITLAVQGLMGADDYFRLGTDPARWAHCYRCGCRVRRVLIITEDTSP